jgi:hypothetical protein
MRRTLAEIVRELDRKLVGEHRFDEALFDELTDLQRNFGIMHGDRPISPFLRPYFLEATRYAEICRAAHVLSGAFDTITDAALKHKEISSLLGLTAAEERFARFEPGYKHVSVTSRLDAFLHPQGFKFLEYNAETPAGVGDQTKLEKMFEHVPAVRDFLSEHKHFFPQPQRCLLEVLDRAYREYGGKKEVPNIAIVDWAGVDTEAEFKILQEYFASMCYPTVICDPRELEYDGRRLRTGDFEIDIFYKRVVIHEFLERYDETHPLSRAMIDGNVCMANSFRSKVPHKKASFAVLSDERFHRLYSNEQLRAIDSHIPWTRRVVDAETTFRGERIDLLEHIRRDRFRFVLKPNDDYGGKGIEFGWECTEAEWDDAIESAVEADYIVQERAAVEKTDIPVFVDGEARIERLTVDFDPYLFMGEVEGGMVRLAAGPLVNITQGGGETALTVLEGF